MKEMRRVLALLLCFVMLVGYVPVGALAAEAETTAPSVAEEALVTEATDAVEDTTAAPEIETTASAETTEAVVETTAAVETTEAVEETTEAVEETAPAVMLTASSAAAAAVSGVLDAAIFCSDVHGNPSTVTSVFEGIKSADSTFDPSTASFVGDTQCAASSVTDAAQSVYSDVECYYAFGNHDDEGNYGISNVTGLLYSGNYYIYAISENDMSVSSPDTDDFTSKVAGLDQTKPLFIISHMPLHARRNDNNGAAAWYEAISAAAEKMDIFFFWAHNHTNENDVDRYAYYVAKNGSETMSIQGGSTVTPNFTYANAGYIQPPNNPTRQGVATAVRIYEDSVNLTVYDENGEYSGTYAVNETVTREFASSTPTLESIAISGGNSYTVGEELALTVTATYSDGSAEDVTTDATLSGYDMTTAGTYTVTATYEGLTATYTIVVADPCITGIAITTLPDNVTFDQGDELDTTGMVVTATYSDGSTAEVTGWYTSSVDMTTAGEKTVTVNYSVNGTTWQATYKITVNEALTDDVTLESVEITTGPTTTEYQVNDALDITGMVVTATFSDKTTKELTYGGFINSDGTSTVASDTFCYYIDGFNMRVEKQQEVVVSYTYGDKTLTDTFVINVWNYEFKDENTGVIVDVADGDYGVTGMTAAYSTNNYVSTAIADYITGTNYKAYDITLTLDSEDSYILTSDAKTVTLPIPEDVNNPVVCYVSDDGATVTNMNAVKDGKGNVTFTTTHFSTYVVGESTEITVPDNDTASGSSTTGGKKTVYVLTSSISSGNSYLIVNGNSAGSYYALANNSGDVDATSVTVKTDDTIGTYIELDDATDELWTVSGSYRFTNSGYYLYGSGSDLSLNSSSYTTWSYSTSNDRLSYTSGSGRNQRTYYLVYGDSGWDTSQTSDNVYFYVPTEIDTTTTVSGTYSIEGEDISAAVSAGSTADLTSNLIFTPESGDATTTDVSTKATYEIVTVDANGNTVNGDPQGILVTDDDGNLVVTDGKVTFTGTYGTALVKVSYVTDFGTVTDYITIEAKAPYYSIDLHYAELTKVEITEFADGVTYYTFNTTTNTYHVATAYVEGNTYYTTPVVQGEVIDEIIALKGINSGDTYSVWAVVLEHNSTYPDGTDLGKLGNALNWKVSDESIATIDTTTGIITFTGTNYGTINVSVYYTGADGVLVEDTITISVTKSLYTVPSDGTDDFPEYPNQGAVRFDKTATAVGNFSETGLAKVELSMTGVPYTTGNELDVVLMLDITGSMHDKTSSSYTYSQYVRVEATIIAAKAFVESIVVNEDGTYNGNRVGVYSFNSKGTYTLVDLGTISSDEELEAAYDEIEGFNDDYASGGTPYDDALSLVQTTLAAAKTTNLPEDVESADDYNRQQFCVFMTDGVPTDYEYVTSSGHSNYFSASSIAGMLTSSDNYQTRDSDYYYEYYSTEMKKDGVTVYSVGLGLENTNSAWSGTATQCLNLASRLLNDISGPAGETTQPDAVGTNTLSKQDSYFFSVDDADAATEMENVFNNIAQKILDAATDVVVEDKIGSDYTVNFGLPSGVSSDATDGLSEFYIQVVEYQLNSDKERTGDPAVLENFTFNADGSLKSHTVDGTACSNCSHVTITDGVVTKIEGTYFTYESTSDGEFLTWKAAKLTTTELALQYFAYLDNSAGIDVDKQVAAGTYYTNEYATLTYTNYKGNKVQQEFPIPQMTWYGAQVSYVFYLVNEAGQPVNRAGKVVPFAEAVYVTDVYTYSVVWNDLEQAAGLEAKYLAENLVPDVYALYDDDAAYNIHVYADEEGVNLNNHFIIGGDVTDDYNTVTNSWTNAKTTYVFNTKADANKYNAHGTYVADDSDATANETGLSYFCKSAIIEGATYTTSVENDVTVHTVTSVGSGYQQVEGETQATVEMIVAAGGSTTGGTVIDDYVYYVDENGDVYTIVQKSNGTEVHKGFDFSNTTVAFAVVWKPQLEADTVVVDYGLDVVIDVITNDGMAAGVVGVLDSPVSNTTINSGTFDTATEAQSVDVYIDANNDDDGGLKELKIGTATVENLNAVRFSLNKENGMQFTDPAVFYYEAGVNYYKDNVLQTTNMYSSVTVIPATTVYYEEDFVTLKVKGTAAWEPVGSVSSTTQDQDRPGASQISSALDADNVYGYDSAYSALSTYSNGAAKKVTVSKDNAGRAEFTFYGTGFDVISMTSSTTGTILVNVYAVDDAGNKMEKKSLIVDTYYGMNADGTINKNNPTDALYQVPVMKVKDLEYGKYYVTITASYSESFDHTSAEGSYDFYLDAIRIYDPTGVASGSVTNTDVLNAYVADGEAYPYYQELREMIIDAVDLEANETEIDGVVFIDCIDDTSAVSDYTNYGPNNEVYLAPDQSIAFELNLAAYAGKVADVQIGMKSATTTAVNVKMTSDASTTSTAKIEPNGESTTDRYFSIGGRVNKSGTTRLIFTNTSTDKAAILSITNIKITYTENPVSTNNLLTVSRSSVNSVLMALNEVEEETPETTEPEVTEPEVTEPEEALDAQLKVSVMNNSVKVGSTVVVKITTSSDVDALTVNGKEISRYTENKFTGVRTWTTTVKASEAGSMDIAVTAYNNGAALDTVTETIEVSGKTAGVIQQIVGQLIGMLFG